MSTRLHIAPLSASIFGFTDRALDDDFDGLFDRIVITVSANVTEAGTYDFSVRLRGSNGLEIQQSVMEDLDAGNASVDVSFTAESLVNGLGVNGPYSVTQVSLFLEDVDGNLVPVGSRTSLGSTGVYDLANAQHVLSRLNGVHSAAGIDTNGNGRFDQLKVSFGVDLDVDSDFYTYSFSLLDSTGHELGAVHTGLVTLHAGSNTIEATFPGLPIGQNGVDGPYVVGKLHMSEELFGSNELNAPFVFSTSAFHASQFEGFVGPPPPPPPPPVTDTTPPTVVVTATPNVLWPADHRMVEVHVTVSAIDDTDPNPVVSFSGVTSNQTLNASDILMQNGKLFLRAERSGKGNQDRVYTLMYSARDASGNVGVGSATVTVPHDQGHK